MTRKTCAKAWATTARPRIATVNQTRSPIMNPAEYATAPCAPRPITRATIAMMPGPGEAAATSSAEAKTMSAVRSMVANPEVYCASLAERSSAQQHSTDHRGLERSALPVMGMRDRDRKGVGRILGLRIGLGEQHADHHADLRLLGMARPNDGL